MLTLHAGNHGAVSVNDEATTSATKAKVVNDFTQQAGIHTVDQHVNHLTIALHRRSQHDHRTVDYTTDNDFRHIGLAAEGFLDIVTTGQVSRIGIRVMCNPVAVNQPH